MSSSALNIIDKNTRVEHGRFSPALIKLSVKPEDEQLIAAAAVLQKELGISLACAKILAGRGITEPALAKSFLNPTLKSDLVDPHQIKNIDAAAELILQFVEEKKWITVFHDFDVDGLTAGTQLTIFLKALGAKVQGYVPNRFIEGYGLSMPAVKKIAEAGTSLLITVDCGISSNEELAEAKRLGMKSIILDHHEPAELPPADVIVDPAQDGCPFQQYKLAAAGLVWMLLIVLRSKLRGNGAEDSAELDPKEYLDLAALGTICDMVPLNDVNRLIAHRGIEAIRTTKRIGLRALLEVSGLYGKPRFGAGQVSFGLGPRINAAGRLDDATQVATLLTTPDSVKAKSLAQSIDRLNTRRRAIEEEQRISCVQQVTSDDAALAAPAIAVYGEDYHLGVIGIVAQRMVEEFHKPAAVMGSGEAVVDGKTCQVIKGSVRSISGFHVSDVLHSLQELLISGGGHAAAGGFTVAVDKLEDFRRAFIAEAAARLTPEMLMRKQRADVVATLSEVDFTLAEELQRLAPFGIGNPSPVLVSEGVQIDSAASLSGKHLKLRISDGKCSRTAVAWGFLGHPLLRKGQQVNIAYQVEINTYQGISSVQLSLKEVWS